MQFCQISKEEYREFVAEHPQRNFLNRTDALDAKEALGWHVEYVGVRRDGKLEAATNLTWLPVLRIYRYYYAQRGFLLDYADQELLHVFVSGLKKYLKKRKGLYLRMDPYVIHKERDIDGLLVAGGLDNSFIVDELKAEGFLHKGFQTGLDAASQMRWMFSLYVNGRTEEEIYAACNQQAKRSIKRMTKQSIYVRELHAEDLAIFLQILTETAERRGFTDMVRSEAFYRTFLQTYGEHGKLLLAYMDADEYLTKLQEEESSLTERLKGKTPPQTEKKRHALEQTLAANRKKAEEMRRFRDQYGPVLNMAASLFTVYDNEIVYVWGGTDNRFRKFDAQYALQWHMIRYAVKHGINRYNFYGLSGDFSEEAVDYGVYQFKRGFGGVAEELLGDFILPIRPRIFKLYDMWKGGSEI